MDDKVYKENLDDRIENLSREVEIPYEPVPLKLSEKIAEVFTNFLGSWSWFWWFSGITFVWLYFNANGIWAFDKPPYLLYTMIISVWAIYGNIWIQQGGNNVLRYIIWILQQLHKSSKKNELSILLLHQKIDLLFQCVKKPNEEKI